ncbi:MAG: endo-1,4-beta-xylanase [bacterium]
MISSALRRQLCSDRSPRLATLAALSLTAMLAACGGDSPGPAAPVAKTCVEDPAQARCAPVTPPVDSGLRYYATKSGRYMGTSLDALFGGTAYNALVAKEFNMFTPGNVLKWDAVHPARTTYNFTKPDAMLAFAQANGMKMRGHTLAWVNQNPGWLTSGTWTADTLTQILKDHIATVVGHYRGTIYAWDVVNEAFNDGAAALRANVWSNVIGRPYIETAFRAARAADPATLLFYNDYNIETAGAKQDSVYNMIVDFKARGVPIDGVGLQAHFLVNADGTGAPSKAQLQATFQRFAALGIRIHVTELDVRVQTANTSSAAFAAQNQAYADIATACFSVTACEALIVWGVTDSESWIPGTFPGWGSALLFDGAMTKKTTYTAVKTGIGG